MMSVVFVSTFMNKYLDRYRETYISHIATYITEGGEEILYFCSELGKQLAIENCSIEDVIAFHQSCLETLTCSSDSFDAQALIKSFDLLTEITVQQTLWLKRETSLKNQAQRMIRDVIEAMPHRIYWKDIKGYYLGCNSAYLRDLGIDSSDVIVGKSSKHTDLQSIHIDADVETESEILSGNLVSHIRERDLVITGDNSLPIKETIRPLINSEQELYGLICCYENLAELKEKEEENKILTNNLSQSQRVESIGRLAGGIAHDYNNMLAVIIGYSQLLERGLKSSELPPKFLGYLQHVLSAADKSKLLTEKLLTFSRKDIIKPEVVELGLHITNTLTTYSSIIDEDIVISIDAASKYWVFADSSHIDQVLLNLIVNARDAMLNTDSSTQKQINIVLRDSQSPHFVSLSIEDNGCGMTEQIKSQIFEPFFTTKKGIGTGLGLATVFTIISQYGGTVSANIEGEVGTEFIIEWPLHKAPPKHHENVSLDETCKQQHHFNNTEKNIVVLEDDKQVRDLLVSVLTTAGFCVFGFESSNLMFHEIAIKGIVVDLLLTDIILSETRNGKQISEQLLALHPRCKVVFVSGYSDDIISKRGIILDNIAHIQKPFSNAELVDIVTSRLLYSV